MKGFIFINYTTFIAKVVAEKISMDEIPKGDDYTLIAIKQQFKYWTWVEGDDVTDYETNYQSLSNKQLDKRSPTTGRPEIQTMKPEGSSATRVTHDWCDKTTWYQESTQVTGETMSDSGDGLTFNSANPFWIDLTHGKLYDEYNLSDKKVPKVYDNAVEVTTGFTIDYSSGDVTFDSTPTGPISCDYWYAGSSCYILAPTPGKTLFIEHAELQFASNIEMNNPMNFQIWVYNPLFNGANPVDADDETWYPGKPGGLNPLKFIYQIIKYKNIRDIINAANLGQGIIPKVSGLVNDVQVFPFNYATVKPFQSSLGAELRVTIDGDIAMTGEWATATFYILSEDE